MSIENNHNNNNQINGETTNLINPENDIHIIKKEEAGAGHDDSLLDQSIEIGQSVEKDEKGYTQLINSETSLYNPRKKLVLKDQPQRLPLFQKLKNAVKCFFSKLPCQSSKVNTDKQLLVSIFLKSGAAFYFVKQRRLLIERRSKSINDEHILRNIDNNLKHNGFLYYDNSTVGQKTLIKGKVNTKLISLTQPIDIKFEKTNQILNLNESRKIVLKTDQFQSGGVPIPLQSKKGMFTSAVAAATYFVSSNIYQFKIKSDSLSNFSDSFYFFGTKSSLTKLIEVDQIFQKIDYLKIKADQRALTICIILSSCLALYFGKKAVFSGVELAKRKRGFFSKLAQDIKEYFQL